VFSLSPTERNKASARAFRARRKSNIVALETTIREKDAVIDALRKEVAKLQKANGTALRGSRKK
jgi:predicted RNase H-like nuclease (RuvC/YqgF family)